MNMTLSDGQRQETNLLSTSFRAEAISLPAGSYSNEQNESFQPLKATLDSSQSPVATSVILQSPHPPTSHPFKQPGQIPASPTYRYISSAQRFASSFSSLLDTEALERIRYQLQHGVNPFLNISASSPDPSSSQAEQQPPTSSNTSFSSTSSQADTASRSTDTTNSSASTLPSASSSSASILRPSSTLTTAGNYQQHDASSRPPMPLGSPSHSLDPGSAQARQLFFQQTSAESFEESLMAGGYGRYKTTEWVRPDNFSAVPSHSERPSHEPEVSEKEVRKRRRLAAFKGDPSISRSSKLCAVELEGKGRVLLDSPNSISSILEAQPNSKKRRKRRRSNEDIPTENVATVEVAEPEHDKPDWPDLEFPWRHRAEERANLAKADERERLRLIERFLDREDSDESDREEELRATVLDTMSMQRSYALPGILDGWTSDESA